VNGPEGSRPLFPCNLTNRAWGDLQSANYKYLWWNSYDSRDSLFMAAGLEFS
jgi:hypothetical protein